MDADRDSNAPRPEISAHVASCVIRVRELDPSLKFYCDVFSCTVAVRETDMALLIAPNGFHIYLHAPSRRHRAVSAAGAAVVDEEVAIDGNLISSRSPDDLPAFCRAIVEQSAKPQGSAS